MRILLLADQAEPTLWEHLDRRKLEGVDLILSCGDLPASYLSFLTCFTTAPVLYIHGNHDGRYAKNPPEGCTCIEDTVYVHEGIRILGLGGCMRYNPRSVHQYTEDQMAMRVKRLWYKLWKSKGFDILVTHAPAFELGDDKDLAHQGFKAFYHLLDKHKPKLFAHGHVHQSYRHDFKRVREYNGTTVVNCCGYYYFDYEPAKKE